MITKSRQEKQYTRHKKYKDGDKRYKAPDDPNEGAEEQLLVFKDMVDRVTGWMEDSRMQTESCLK